MSLSTPISTPDSRLTCKHCHRIGYASTELSPIAEGFGTQRRHGQQAFTHPSNAHHKRVRLGSRLACLVGHRFALPNEPSILADLVIANSIFVEVLPCMRRDFITSEHYFFGFGHSIAQKTHDETPSSGI
jgi:hypothetical protein